MRVNGSKISMIVVSVLLVAAIATAGYFYNKVRVLSKNPQTVAEQEVKNLVAKVSTLIVLPEGETPTVATVSDTAALKEQPFFAKAQNGDKVLIYTTAKRAILYSLTLNKILEVAPLNIGESAKATTPKPTTPPTTNKKN